MKFMRAMQKFQYHSLMSCREFVHNSAELKNYVFEDNVFCWLINFIVLLSRSNWCKWRNEKLTWNSFASNRGPKYVEAYLRFCGMTCSWFGIFLPESIERGDCQRDPISNHLEHESTQASESSPFLSILEVFLQICY